MNRSPENLFSVHLLPKQGHVPNSSMLCIIAIFCYTLSIDRISLQVASEEHRIKDEPEDSPDELDQNSLCISEEIEDRQDDDEFALKISDDQGNHSESYQSNRTMTDQQHLELVRPILLDTPVCSDRQKTCLLNFQVEF